MKKGKSYSKDRRQVRAREKAAFRSGTEVTKVEDFDIDKKSEDSLSEGEEFKQDEWI